MPTLSFAENKDSLEEMFAGSNVDLTIEIPNVGQTLTAPPSKEKHTVPATSSAVKSSKPGSDKGSQKKGQKDAPEASAQRVRKEREADSRDDKSRGANLQKDKRQKREEKESSVEELTEADFAAVAKVAKLGADAIKKMKAAVAENNPTRLEELLKENRRLEEEVEKNAGLLARMTKAEAQAAENKRKAAELPNVAANLEAALEELARVWKEVEDSKARVSELEKRCQKLKDDGAIMAKTGYTRCLSQALVLQPNLQTQYMQLLYREEDGKILSKEGVVFPPEVEEEDAENADQAGNPGNVGGEKGSPAAAKSPAGDDMEIGEN